MKYKVISLEIKIKDQTVQVIVLQRNNFEKTLNILLDILIV